MIQDGRLPSSGTYPKATNFVILVQPNGHARHAALFLVSFVQGRHRIEEIYLRCYRPSNMQGIRRISVAGLPSLRTTLSSKRLNQPPTSLASTIPLTNLYESLEPSFVPAVSETRSSGVSPSFRGHGTHCLTIMQQPVGPDQLRLLFANIRDNRSRRSRQ